MATLKSLVDETTNIKNELVECRDNLKNVLIDKNINDATNENNLTSLISKVDTFPKIIYTQVGGSSIIHSQKTLNDYLYTPQQSGWQTLELCRFSLKGFIGKARFKFKIANTSPGSHCYIRFHIKNRNWGSTTSLDTTGNDIEYSFDADIKDSNSYVIAEGMHSIYKSVGFKANLISITYL